ncbi:MAG: AAA family ATPase [Thermoplasmatales archaeon]|nr:AAA family ATPase [Thermoplasmatales archaeon]
MKILSIGSVNCLTFGKDSTIELEGGVTAIVGPNGSGKTNLVRLIQYVSQILARRSDPFKPSDIISVGEATFRVEVKVMFTEVERQAILDFLLCTLVTETSNWKGDNTITTGDLEELKNNLLLMKSKEIFRDFPHQVTVIIYWEGANNFTPSFGFKLSLDGRDFYLNSMGTFLSVLEERNFGSQSLTFLIVDYLSQHFSNYKGSERGKELVDKLSLEFGERSYEPPTLGDFLKVVGIGPGGVQVGGVVQALTFSYFENKLSTSLSLKPKRDLLLQQEGRFLRFLERRNFRASVVSLTDLISTIFNSSIVTLPSPRNRPPDSIELKTSELVPDRSYSIYTEDIPSSVTIEGDQIPSILFELWTSSDYKSIGSFETIKEEFLKLTGYRITVSVDWREKEKCEPRQGRDYVPRFAYF